MALDSGDIGDPVAVGNNLILFEVSDRQRFDPQEFVAAKEETRDGLERQRLQLMLSSLIERRRNELEVHLDPSFVQNFQLPTGAT